MENNSIHGLRSSKFPSPSPHRLPTVSAAQALRDLKSSPSRCISTGMKLLDCALQNREPVAAHEDPFYGGVSRGKVTEIYGPPGVGKTALGMQLTAAALYAGEAVLWVDASHPLPGFRLSQILSSYRPLIPPSTTPPPRTASELASDLTHYSTPTLAHLLALLTCPSATNPPSNTSLIVVDSLSTLISNAFPRDANSNATKKPSGTTPAARKPLIIQTLITAFQKLAATRNVAVVLLSQCVTKMRIGAGAVLVPAINTTSWEQALGTRVALFRDWGWDDEDCNPITDVRLAQIVKAEGVVVPDSRPRLIGFTITEAGLGPLDLPARPVQLFPPSTNTNKGSHAPSCPPLDPSAVVSNIPQKRKISNLEIPDSEDEDYGWAEEDEEELPPPAPQWQGSEDLLIDRADAEEEQEDEEEMEKDRERVIEDSDEDVLHPVRMNDDLKTSSYQELGRAN